MIALIIAVMAFGLFAQEGVSGGTARVLLAYEKTGFKELLIEEMSSILEKDSVEVTAIIHSKGGLDKQKASDYQAIFITNSGVNSKVRPWITEWLSKNEARAGAVLLHTTQTRNWKVDVKVDAVTSASKKKEVKTLAAQYVEMIKSKLQDAVEETEPAAVKEQKSSDE